MGLTVDSTRWHPRIAWMMLAIVLLPVAGLVWLAFRQASDASQHRDEVASVALSIDDLIDLIRFESAIADEKHWSYATRSLDEMGISHDLVVEMAGIDLWAEQETASRRVDALARATGSTDVLEQVQAIRTDAALSPVGLDGAFDAVEAEVRDRVTSVNDRLDDLPETSELAESLRTLRLAADVRDDLAIQMASFFALRFSSTLTSEEAMRQLIARDDRYRANVARLHDDVRPDTQAARILDGLDAHDGIRVFTAEVRGSIQSTLEEGAAEAIQLDLDTLMNDVDSLSTTFLAAHSGIAEHMRLVEAAADDVAELAVALDEEATREMRDAILLGMALTVLAVSGAVLGGRSIVTPLRRMSEVAEAMRRGSLGEHLDESGPRELRTAARAMNEAVDQLQLAERQALALARGDLDDPVLEITAPGALGQSLRDAVAHLTSSLNDREEFRRRLAHEAAHDPLTGLPNRTASLAHLTRALGRSQRTGDRLAVLLIDLDGFKQINELHGHGAGDRVLVQVAQRLTEVARQSDVVGRLGADEFIVVAEPVGDDEEAARIAVRLSDTLTEAITSGGRQLSITASVGISTADGSIDADALIREADVAVIAAKRHGGARIQFCDDELRAQIASRSAVERGLAAAIEDDALVLYVQQIVDARTEEPRSMEALVRWIDPEVGLIPPAQFIPAAEASDLIIALDRWVLDDAAAQLSRWTGDPVLARMPLAVNISGRHLRHPHLVDHVLDPLRARNVDPRRLTVEVTETALLDDLAAAATHLAALREAGVRVAIDDFGTGYTSLAHLRALPVDVLKIDGSFISNLAREDERTLVRMIVEVGHLFGLEVVAEGVETMADARELLLLGVDAMQGFHYSTPGPAADLGTRSSRDADLSR